MNASGAIGWRLSRAWLPALILLSQAGWMGDEAMAQGRRRPQQGAPAVERQVAGGEADDDASADEEAPPSEAVRLPGQVGFDELTPQLRCGIGRPGDCPIAVAIEHGLFETGLRPQFPDGVQCRDIDEQFAISYAAKRGREQYHGGIDMPAPLGTPMIAAADGVVVGRYEGFDSYRGKEIILRHRPEDTGFPFYIYTQYAHLDTMPKLQVGDVVRMGQELGPTGNSGIGRHSGQSGKRRPAIHFAAWFTPSEKYVALRGKVIPLESRWMDPNALYLPKDHPLDSASLKALPDARKRVPVAALLADGTVVPKGARVVWPYHCWKM